MDLLETLDKAERVLILAHHNADIDAVGASIPLKEYLGKKAELAVPDTVSKGARDLAKDYDFMKSPEDVDYDVVVVLDCPTSEQLKPLDLKDFEATKVLIDHHSPSDLIDTVDLAVTDPEARSTSEIVYEILAGQWDINKKAAEALICGIVADTSHLRLAEEKQFKIISELLPKTDGTYSEILSVLSTPIDRSERIARLKAVSRSKIYEIGEKILVFSYVGSFEAASARTLLKVGADIAIVFSPRSDSMRVSGRCRRELTEDIHLGKDLFSEIQDLLDGSAGGHDAAASGNGRNADMEEIKNAMISILEDIFDGKIKEL